MNLETFLRELTNSELAAFVGYRYREFLPNSQEKIKSEVQRRRLNQETLAELFQSGIQNSVGDNCPNCNSVRKITETDRELRGGTASYEVIIETERCQICGHNPAKRKARNWIDAIILKFGRHRNVRLARNSEKVFKDF